LILIVFQKILAKTPIWTGNIDSKSDAIQPTGIMGSLRWWTEALLRGMEEFACDPTSNSRCPDDGNYCPSCLIFGATGRRRLFRLEINGGERISFRRINIKPSNRSRGWFFGPGVAGNLELKMISLDGKFDEVLVLTPLIIASKWGGIGAKTQLGYGVVEVTNPPDISFENFKKVLENLSQKGKRQRSNEPGFPDLREMFFAKIRFKVNKSSWWKEIDGITEEETKQAMEVCIRNDFLPIAPVIKNWLRYGDGSRIWRSNQNVKGLENWLFGTSKKVCPKCYSAKIDKESNETYKCRDCGQKFGAGEIINRCASKINISCAYKISDDLWEIRIWGWIPQSTFYGFQRESFLNNLKDALSSREFYTLLGNQTSDHRLDVWREYASNRDTIKEERNFDDFIESLLREDK
jgi:CRISPR-associated protein Cmr1